MLEDTSLLDDLIVGFVPHKIYAFSTPQAENYLKVGDTSRSVGIRLEEWKRKIPDLTKEGDWLTTVPIDAEEQNDFFRDFALHRYFKNNGFSHLESSEAPGNSQEFYKVTLEDIESGIQAIRDDYDGGMPYTYDYLSIKDNSKIQTTWNRTEDFKLRDNQKQVIDNLLAVKDDETVPKNYLLFAVMRFGKTFVALQAAKALKSHLTVVVSAKADVAAEWKQNLESHKDFEGYKFLDSNALKASPTALVDELSCFHVVLFLTLQDLNGNSIKKKHKQVFENIVDLLIVDESHFGARAQNYGRAIFQNIDSDDNEKDDEVKALENVKAIKRRKTLHLSGTPYRILMGDEFNNPKQIIGKIQFEDILEAKEKWYLENLEKPEWENPYFGFPQMVRFGFNLNSDAKEKFLSLSNDGASGQFSELFGTESSSKKNSNYNVFKHESKVIEILKAFDGTGSSKTIFPILNYEKIQNGKMAQHIVMVLPFKASCDAMELLFQKYKSEFFNFNEYQIINIAGHDSKYINNDLIKQEIKILADSGQKTISLTVNKMLTGVTVPQWDTMIFLKDTHSPQEYDQAIYRLQSPYITKQVDKNGNVVNKVDLKPQTLLIDLSPERMMSLEQYKAFVLSATEGNVSNERVQEALIRQMSTSPIITVSNDKLTLVEPTDVIKYVAAYSSERGIIEEAQDIIVDLSIMDNEILKSVIENEGELGGRSGLKFKQNSGGSNEVEKGNLTSDVGDSAVDTDNTDDCNNNIKSDSATPDSPEQTVSKIKNFYLRLLFYAFLSKEVDVNSLGDIIETYDSNARLANHLGIEKNILLELDKSLKNSYARIGLDNKISNANSLLVDDTVEQAEKVARAIRSFDRISENEVFTPREVVEKMVDSVLIEINNVENLGTLKFLDIGCKSGVFLLALFEKLEGLGYDRNIIRNNFYAIVTSPIAYEFTRKVYELMGIPTDNIIDVDYLSSYDLLRYYENGELQNIIGETFPNMKFDAIIGNPPYQEQKIGTSDNPIYHRFMDMSYALADKVCLITPGRFLFNAGKTPKKWNKKLLSDKHFKVIDYIQNSEEVFPNTDIKGGIAITYRDKSKSFEPIETFTTSAELSNIFKKVYNQENFQSLSEYVYAPESYKLTQKFHDDNPNMESRLSKGHKYDVTTNIFEKLPEIFIDFKSENTYSIIGRQDNQRVNKYVKKSYINGPENFEKYKVILPKSNGSGKFGEPLSKPFVGKPFDGHTQTFLSIGCLNTEQEGEALLKYLKTKFVRALLGVLKITQDNKKSVWKYVPYQDFSDLSDIDWSVSVKEIDKQLFKKYSLDDSEQSFVELNVQEME